MGKELHFDKTEQSSNTFMIRNKNSEYIMGISVSVLKKNNNITKGYQCF